MPSGLLVNLFLSFFLSVESQDDQDASPFIYYQSKRETLGSIRIEEEQVVLF